MAKLIQVSKIKAEKGRKGMKRMFAMDEFWKEEDEKIKKFEDTEKKRRDDEHAARDDD